MEDKKLNEQESLALIAQMIQNSKKGLVVGSGNSFLFWGYLTLAVSIAIFVLLYFTGSQSWFWLGSVIPVIGCLYIWWMSRRDGKRTMSYVDKVISNVWQIVGGNLCHYCSVGFELWKQHCYITSAVTCVIRWCRYNRLCHSGKVIL